MAIYSIYATAADLAEYLDVDEATLPEGHNKLLRRASELIKQITLNNPILTNEAHVEALKLATCAQVEFWIEVGESTAISGNVPSFSLGDLSMNFGEAQKAIVCDRAKAYLNQQGLLFKGISLGYREVQEV